MYIVHKFCRCATAKLTWPKKPESRNLISRSKESAPHKAGDFVGGLLLNYPAMSVLYLLALRQTIF